MDHLEVLKSIFLLVMKFSKFLPPIEEFSEMKSTEIYSFLYVALFGPRKMKEISDFLSTTKSNVTVVVDALETRGLVRREHDPADRRTYQVVLTEKGRELFEKVKESFGKLMDSVMAKLSPDDRLVIGEGFKRMVEVLLKEG